MVEVVIDTNVLLVADGKHPDVSEECVLACAERLETIKRSGRVVIDDSYRIIGEYQNKIDSRRGKGIGAVFLKWLLQNQANSRYVARVQLKETSEHRYAEFPVTTLEADFDPPDRVFPAVSNARSGKPRILQAVDSKWLRWWPELKAAGIAVEFLCPEDVCRFYAGKFPKEPIPPLP